MFDKLRSLLAELNQYDGRNEKNFNLHCFDDEANNRHEFRITFYPIAEVFGETLEAVITTAETHLESVIEGLKPQAESTNASVPETAPESEATSTAEAPQDAPADESAASPSIEAPSDQNAI